MLKAIFFPIFSGPFEACKRLLYSSLIGKLSSLLFMIFHIIFLVVTKSKMYLVYQIISLLCLMSGLALAAGPRCAGPSKKPLYDPNSIKTSCDRALNEIYREAVVTGFTQRMIFRKASPFLANTPSASNDTSDLTARSPSPTIDKGNLTLGGMRNSGCHRGVCPLPMSWDDPVYLGRSRMACAFTLDVSYDAAPGTEDVLSLGQVWEVGKDLRLQCGDMYMATQTIGTSEKIRLSKRFILQKKPVDGAPDG